ncbi:MAG: AGE family epimerase/isomerase [Pseudomonadota bacterium]
MNFRDGAFLRDHIRSILDFYDPVVIDPSGGYFQNFLDDGTTFDPGTRHLVSSCRIPFNYSKGFELFDAIAYRDKAAHGIEYLRHRHWNAQRQGFEWTLSDAHQPNDQTNYCYGLAFVILAAAAAHDIGIPGSLDDLQRAVTVLEERFWDADTGLYADEATADWSSISAYRGQNANMHCCEAMIAAWEATSNVAYLDRAYELATRIARDIASQTDGLIWEHYTSDLRIDWDFNKDDPRNLYRPWGFQPGHQTEWSKLLLQLHSHRPEAWMTERAMALFDAAVDVAWDASRGGLYYGFAPDGSICDDEKYFWVQAESFAAAARLYAATGLETYADWYDRLWQYAWDHMVDHQHGAWFRVLSASNQKLSDQKSTAGGKCDYHTLGACWDVLRSGAFA